MSTRSHSPALLGLALLLAIDGCSDDGTVTASSAVAMAKGNWQISSSSAAAAALPVLSGEFSAQGSSLAGILHAQGSSTCVSPATSFAVTGSADANNLVTLIGPLAGGTFSLTGTLAADGKSLGNASYTVTGGACAFAALPSPRPSPPSTATTLAASLTLPARSPR